jgi:hypothetical protein
MGDEKEQDELGEGVEETADAVVIDLGVDAKGKEAEEKGSEPEPETEKESAPVTEKSPESGRDVDYEAILARVREDLKPEPKKEEKVYSDVEFKAARREVARRYEAGEIGFGQYQDALDQIDDVREGQRAVRLKSEWSSERNRQDAERNVVAWARENAPQFLDARTKEARDAETFAAETLGVVDDGDYYKISKKIGRIAWGLLHASTTGKSKDAVSEAEKRGVEKGVKMKDTRREDLKKLDTPPKGGKDSGGKAPVSDEDRKVLENLGVSGSRVSSIAGKMRQFKDTKRVEVK